MPKWKQTFQITEGVLDVSGTSLLNDQYYRIIGSVFNDGVHKVGDSDLTDETFDGCVRAMAVPPTVIALAKDIEDWQSKYGGVDSEAMSPFNSESFAGYGYSKSGGGSGSGSTGSGAEWKSVFAGRMNRWRKIL